MRTTDTPSDEGHNQNFERQRIGRKLGGSVSLPGGRAVLGGVLVATAAVLLAFGARSTSDELPTYVVATADLDAGSAIAAGDLGLAPMDLYSGTADGAFTDPDELIGNVAIAPVAEGNLIARNAVVAETPPPSAARNVGLSLDPADALNGSIKRGDRVDVIARSDNGATVLIESAVVTDVLSSTSNGVGSLSSVDLTLSVPSLNEATQLISATSDDGITLVAASGIETEK